MFLFLFYISLISLYKYDIILLGDKSMQNKNKKTNNIIKNKKIIIIIVIIIIILSCIKLNRNNTPKDDNLIYNNNKSFIKTQKVKGIVFKNIECSYDGKDSLLTYTIINDTKKKIYLKNYDVYVKDKHNTTITKIAANVTQTIKPKEELQMANQVVGVDLSKAYYLELKLKTK